MSWTLVQAGTALYALGTDGVATALTLPTNVTLDVTRKLRAAILGRRVVVVNASTINIVVDPDGTVRGLVPRAPVAPPMLAAGSSTGLTGVFRVKFSYGIKDRFGRVISESPLSPAATITAANTGIAVSAIAISNDDSVNCRFLYRTTTGGELYFRWADLDDNVQTTIDNNLADAGLSLLPTLNANLGLPPGSAGGTRMRLIVQWNNSLWGVSDDPTDVDNVRFCEPGLAWAWPAGNVFAIPRVGATTEGVTVVAARRNDLMIGKRTSVHKIVGDSTDNYQRITVTEGAGFVAPDAMQVIRDIIYGLGEDGVYRYDDNGMTCISKEQVDEWFTSDTYFNRSRFPYAEGRWNPDLHTYDLHLSAVGSTTLDRWVSYDIQRDKWLGPHKTATCTPSCAAVVLDAAGSFISLVGATDGFIYTTDNAVRTDGTATAIDFDVNTVHTCNTPDIEKQFLQMDVLSKVEVVGTLSVTPTVGGLDASPQAAMSYDLTLGRQRGVYIGPGRILQLRWRHNTVGQDVTLYGAELPFFELGRK